MLMLRAGSAVEVCQYGETLRGVLGGNLTTGRVNEKGQFVELLIQQEGRESAVWVSSESVRSLEAAPIDNMFYPEWQELDRELDALFENINPGGLNAG